MRIAILSYKFHPFPGVGANRWSNFAKQFARLDQDVTVFTVNWRQPGTEPVNRTWENIKVIETESLLHRVSMTGGFFGKVVKKILAIFCLTSSKLGFYKDEASHWRDSVLHSFSAEHSRLPFDIVIATGGPFSVLLTAAKLKSLYPKVFLVQDFRDPFWPHTSEGPSSWQFKRLKDKLKESVTNASMVTTVSNSLAKKFKKLFEKKHIAVYTNGYDADLLKQIGAKVLSAPTEPKFTNFSMVHNGNLTNGRQKTLIEFVKLLNNSETPLKNCDFEITNQGYINHRTTITLQSISPRVNFKAVKSIGKLESLYSVLDYDFCLHVGSRNTPFALSTKIFEYIGLQRRIISINYGGEIERLLNNQKNSISLNMSDKKSSNNEKKLTEFLKSERSDELSNTGFDFSEIAKNLLTEISCAFSQKNI